MDFQLVYESYQPDLQRVDQLLKNAIQSENIDLTASSMKLLEAGGKRIRPLFALICGKLGSTETRDVDAVAGALELVHMASLVHDDVIDDSLVRRGQPTVRAKYGSPAAMYTGDFLFARAIQILCTINDTTVHRVMSEAIVRVCEGEIEQIRDFFHWKQTFRNYLRRIERKTALLISVSCSLGAKVSSATTDTVFMMEKFGYYTGMAFQIVDDILDFTGDELLVGKPVGGDLRQGNITLPTLFAVLHPTYGPEIQAIVSKDSSSEDILRAVDLVRATDALQQTRGVAKAYLDKAMSILNTLPASQQREELATVARFVNQRLY